MIRMFRRIRYFCRPQKKATEGFFFTLRPSALTFFPSPLSLKSEWEELGEEKIWDGKRNWETRKKSLSRKNEKLRRGFSNLAHPTGQFLCEIPAVLEISRHIFNHFVGGGGLDASSDECS